ncbi:MAG: hypothetical protein KatS3mg056_1732 [Chloroflexus sp.]|nr:MAG: hypothetical protein KatS3mg056_1732 [Chloroflexus sp.]
MSRFCNAILPPVKFPYRIPLAISEKCVTLSRSINVVCCETGIRELSGSGQSATLQRSKQVRCRTPERLVDGFPSAAVVREFCDSRF